MAHCHGTGRAMSQPAEEWDRCGHNVGFRWPRKQLEKGKGIDAERVLHTRRDGQGGRQWWTDRGDGMVRAQAPVY